VLLHSPRILPLGAGSVTDIFSVGLETVFIYMLGAVTIEVMLVARATGPGSLRSFSGLSLPLVYPFVSDLPDLEAIGWDAAHYGIGRNLFVTACAGSP
jgi:hypothetical protein